MVTATHGNAVIGVLFDVDYDFIVRNGCFQRGTTLKFLKYFRTFFVSILGQRHGVIILFEPIRNGLSNGGKYLEIYFLFVCFEGARRKS